MRMQAGEHITLNNVRIQVIGLAKLGRRGNDDLLDRPTSLSMPAHQLDNVYAGLLTHKATGEAVSKPIPVLLFINEQEQVLHARTNNILGRWIGSMKL